MNKAKIHWLIDDAVLGISIDKVEEVDIDVAHICSSGDVYAQAQQALADKYNGMMFGIASEFCIDNINEFTYL